MNNLRVRALTPRDSDIIGEVLADDGECLQRIEGRAADATDVEGLFTGRPPSLGSARKLTYGLFEDDQLVAVADVLDGWPQEDAAYIGLLQVRGSLHGQGLGRAFHDELLGLLSDKYRWRLSVLDANAQALGFWERLGYRETGERKPWTGKAGAEHTAILLEFLRS